MNFQDKFDEYKQKKEAREFFRENNDAIISAGALVKAGIVGLIVAIIGGVVIQKIAEITGYTFSIAYILMAIAISTAMKKTISNSGIRLAIVAVGVYFVGLIIGLAIQIYSFMGMGFMSIEVIVFCTKYLFSGNILATLMLLLGAFVCWNDAKN